MLDGESKKLDHPYAREWNASAPRAKGGWEFVPGTDLSFAVVGIPDLSKFSLMRRDVINHSKKHIPLFPKHTHFDRHSVEDIAALNKWRDQVQKRTLGNIGKLAAPFTQPEKEMLTNLVENDLTEKKGGSKVGQVDWAKVTIELHKAFKGRTQKVRN